jgi:hypothetical protein
MLPKQRELGCGGIQGESPNDLGAAFQADCAETRSVVLDIRPSVWDSSILTHSDWLKTNKPKVRQKKS